MNLFPPNEAGKTGGRQFTASGGACIVRIFRTGTAPFGVVMVVVVVVEVAIVGLAEVAAPAAA